MRSSEREKDEIVLQNRLMEIARENNVRFTHVTPEDRPVELVQLIDEQAEFFSHYNGQVVDQSIGDTMSFDYMDGISLSIRHYYPYDPEAPVDMNEMGGGSPHQRLVPVSLMSRDLDLDSVLIGRFVAGITKYSARREEGGDFCIQILVMSVCGNGTFRENLTFRGREISPAPAETSITTQDFALVAAIFQALEKGYGTSGIEFFTLEVMRNRYYLSEMAGRDIGMDMAFDAYIKLFGSYMGDFLKNYRGQVAATSQRLSAEHR